MIPFFQKGHSRKRRLKIFALLLDEKARRSAKKERHKNIGAMRWMNIGNEDYENNNDDNQPAKYYH